MLYYQFILVLTIYESFLHMKFDAVGPKANLTVVKQKFVAIPLTIFGATCIIVTNDCSSIFFVTLCFRLAQECAVSCSVCLTPTKVCTAWQ